MSVAENPTNQNVAANSNFTLTSNQANITGGTVVYYTANSARDVYSTQSKKNYFMIADGAAYYVITLNNGETFKAGDEISYTMSATSRGLQFNNTNSTSGAVGPETSSTETNYTYTIKSTDPFVEKSSIYIYRKTGNNTYFNDLTITHISSDDKTNLTGSWSIANPEFENGAENPTIPTFSVTTDGVTLGTQYTVSYALTTNGGNVTVDASNGITAIDTETAGTSVVTATINIKEGYTDNYKATTASYTCTIKVKAGLTAVSDQFWKVSDDDWAGNNNLELIGSFGNKRGINESGADTIDGITFTKESKISAGTGNAVHFKVAGNTVITVYGRSNNNSGTTANIYLGSISGAPVATASWSNKSAGKVTYINSDADEKDIYMCGTSKEWNLFGIQVQPNTTREFTSTNSVEVGGTTYYYRTFVAPVAVDFTQMSGVTAYAVTAATASSITLAEVEKAAANTPLILRSTTTDATVLVAAEGETYSGKNLLKAGSVKGDGSSHYVLGKDASNNFGFGLLANGVTLTADKAYIPASEFTVAGGGAKPSFVALFGETTGIEGVKSVRGEEVKKGSSAVYTLDGRKVSTVGSQLSTLPKGIYIVNGKKYVVK